MNIQEMIKDTYSNLKFYVRDVDIEDEIIYKYKIGDIIYEKAFAGCTAMNSIIIPKGVKKMEGGVFSGWGKNQTIYIENLTEKPSDWSDNWLDGCNANIVWGYQPT